MREEKSVDDEPSQGSIEEHVDKVDVLCSFYRHFASVLTKREGNYKLSGK